jgi:hypothetical protein
MEPYARVDAYYGMFDQLRAVLNREIDLVMVGAVRNSYVGCPHPEQCFRGSMREMQTNA